jgi:hypothetical protein
VGDGMAMKYAVYNNVLFDAVGNARLERDLLLGTDALSHLPLGSWRS